MSSEADDTGGIFTRTRTRKRTRAVLDSARESDTRVVTFEDIPRDIKNEILGEAKLPDPVDRALVRVVSRSMRDAVDATGRDIEKLNTNTECSRAAELGWLSTLKNRLRRGILDKPSVCKSAAKFGHLEILKWARENGCPWDEETCANLARGGHLETLLWAHENDCPWDERTCASAAWGGHFEMLKWARENGCPWDEQTWEDATCHDQVEVMKWLRENGCPCYDCE